MRSDIRVSFVDNEEEDALYDKIMEASKYTKKATWMKLAAREKLERDEEIKQRLNQTQQIPQQGFGTKINSMDQFFG